MYSLSSRLTSTGGLGGGGKAVDVSAGHFWIKANSCIFMSLNILWNGARDIIYEKVGPILL